MSRQYLTGVAIAAMVALNACSSGNSPSTTVVPEAPTVSKNAVTTPILQKAPTIASSKPIRVEPVPPNLIGTTDKTKRQQELNMRIGYDSKLNRDPFNAIPGTVAIPQFLPPAPIPRPTITAPPTRSSSKTAAKSYEIRTYTPPKPKEAEVVNITGAVEIGGTRYAIISMPGDVTSRYVQVGQSVAEDKVLVKWIEMSRTPRVVLEQNGIEYVRTVGR